MRASPAGAGVDAARAIRAQGGWVQQDPTKNLGWSVRDGGQHLAGPEVGRAVLSSLSPARVSWKSSRPSRSATSATSRSPIRRASPRPARRSRPTRRGREPHLAPEPRRRDLERHRRARPRRYRPARLEARDGGQGGPVQEIRRHRRLRHRGRRERASTSSSTWSRRSSRPSAASTSRTSRRPNASRSRSASRPAWASRSSTTTSTAPPSSSAAAVTNALELAGKRIDDVKIVTSGAGRRGARLPQPPGLARRPAREHLGHRHRGRRLRGPRDAHGPLEVGLRPADRRRARLAEVIADADVFLGLSAGGVLKPEFLARMAPRPLDPGARQPEPGDHAGGGRGGAARRDDLHRALGLSEPGQQRPVLPLHLPRRARRRRDDHQRGDEGARPSRRSPRSPARRPPRWSRAPMAARRIPSAASRSSRARSIRA